MNSWANEKIEKVVQMRCAGLGYEGERNKNRKKIQNIVIMKQE